MMTLNHSALLELPVVAHLPTRQSNRLGRPPLCRPTGKTHLMYQHPSADYSLTEQRPQRNK
jgi:hypothetical protein